MLIKNENRILSCDGTKTYRSIGFAFTFNNRFFNGRLVINFKYGYRDLDRKFDSGSIKHGVHYLRVRGFETKYLELRLVDIPKGK